MRAIIFTVFLSTFIIFGCSKDELNESFDEQAVSSSFDEKAGALSLDFQFKENGKFKSPNSFYCYGGNSIESNGFIDEENVGKFFTTYMECTDASGFAYIEANFTDMEGDKIFFFADKVDIKTKAEMTFEMEAVGGTGKYANVNGLLKITNIKDYKNFGHGSYVNSSIGTLTY